MNWRLLQKWFYFMNLIDNIRNYAYGIYIKEKLSIPGTNKHVLLKVHLIMC